MHLSSPLLEPAPAFLSTPRDEPAATLLPLIADLGRAIEQALLDARDLPARLGFEAARLALAEALAHTSPRAKSGHWSDPLRRLLSRLAASGLQDAPWSPADSSFAASLDLARWPGLVARIVIGPAARDRAAPRFANVPDEWWSAFAEWAFQAPQGFVVAGEAEAYARHYLPLLEELAGWIERNPGSATVRGAAQAYLRVSNQIPLYFSAGPLRAHAAARGRILTRLLGVRGDTFEGFALPREGRRLRVGFVNRHFGPQTETYTTLPSFECLDPERFEVLLFACRSDHTTLEQHCRARAASFEVLPADVPGQLAALRAAGLDVVVWGTNLTAVTNEITRLALHRVAPLQVVNNSSCITSGLPECDLYVSGDLTELEEAPAHFTERLGLLPGPTHAFNYQADHQPPSRTWTRAELGIPDEAFVFVSAANYFKVIPEMREAWARLLAAVPGSRLLLHPFNPNWSSAYPIQRFRAEFDSVLDCHRVERERLIVSTYKLPSRSDVGALLAVGDLCLDTAPFGGVNSLIDPLEHGLPVVAWEGRTMRARMGAALLRSLGLTCCIATDAESYHALAVRLASNPAARAALADHIRSSMALTPIFLDSLAASDAFGALIETAYDEIASIGHRAFRETPAPLRARVPAALTILDRRAEAARLLASGRSGRACELLLAALQQAPEADASLWLEVARALRADSRHNEALQALEAALRFDEHLVEGWALLAEIAESQGNHDLATEARALATGRPAATSAPDNRTHVLLYTDDPEHGGVAQYNHTLLQGLVAAGHRVSCVQTRSASPLVARQAELGVRHHWLDYDTGKDFARTVTDEAPARAVFAADRPDLIVFSDCSPVSNLAARDAALSLGIPYVCVVGFVGEYLAKNFARSLPRLAAHYAAAREVVAVSRENLSLLHTRFGLSPDRGRVIHYGRPATFFAPRDESRRASLRAELGLRSDDVLCLTVARLAEVKGHDLLLEAAARLAASPEGARVHYAFVGGGDLRDSLAARARRLGLAERVHFLGQRWDTDAWYDAADLFLLPSRMEGMPLAIMEAMAKALPVVATAVSGIPEELEDTGVLLPNPAADPALTIAALHEALLALVSNPARRASLGAAGRARAEALFREELMVGRTLDLVASCLAPATTR
ncbi:MAG: glycosyltransferase [Opitutaceae bacterium]|nr:glycosyltransferase [Opitutaceae bacterium]